MKKLINTINVLFFFLLNAISQEEDVKNIILLIGDGMGIDHVYAAMTVSKDKLNIERAQYIGISKTYSANRYITDSGAGGTAMATGTKTKNSTIGVDTNGIPLKSILKYAEENSKSTGIVTTCELCHATPATFVANAASRYYFNDITKDFLKVEVDVLIGGGQHRFDSLGVIKSFKEKGYQVSYDINDIDPDIDNPIACFIASEHPKSILNGRDTNYLSESVNLALKHLSINKNGFFLLIEGSQIDWGGHSNDLEFIITELLDFDKAVGRAFDYADINPGTLVIVTADHETGGLTLPEGNIKNHSVKGAFSTTEHTGAMVPIYTYGARANEFSRIMENTDIFYKMMKAFGFEQ